MWVAIIAVFSVALATHFAFKPSLAISPPVISHLGNTCTVSFNATNNTDKHVTANLVVIVRIGIRGGKSGRSSDTEFARKPISTSFWPKESKDLSCEFPVSGWPRPNTARVEILSAGR